jgi:monofunctional biosynthetic peptidoglycan transglycosylase
MIEQRRAEARAKRRTLRVRQSWVPLDRVAPVLVHAVILSEDARFFGHEGFDWEAIRSAAERNLEKGRYAAGASTITQQLAKNLWLGTEKTLTRKAREAVLAAKLERALSKRRILALYLNVAEFDDGVFGVEAGAQHRFGTSAAALTPAQAAVMAAMLPAPRRVDLARPSTWLARRSRRILDRLRDAGRVTVEAHLSASAELERILAGPRPADDAEEPPDEDGPGRRVAAAAEPGPIDSDAPAVRETPADPSPEPTARPAAHAPDGHDPAADRPPSAEEGGGLRDERVGGDAAR